MNKNSPLYRTLALWSYCPAFTPQPWNSIKAGQWVLQTIWDPWMTSFLVRLSVYSTPSLSTRLWGLKLAFSVPISAPKPKVSTLSGPISAFSGLDSPLGLQIRTPRSQKIQFSQPPTQPNLASNWPSHTSNQPSWPRFCYCEALICKIWKITGHSSVI